MKALAAAKTGFGEQDPHVAAAANNLAELLRLRKLYDEAAPLYEQVPYPKALQERVFLYPVVAKFHSDLHSCTISSPINC